MPKQDSSPTRVIATIILGSAFVCALVTYLLILESCLFLNCVEERSFNAVDLGLAPELFPPNAIVNPMTRPSTSEGAFESGSTAVYWANGGLATYKVWRYRKVEEASRTFLAESRGTLYVESSSDFYHSSIADQFAVGCGFREHSGYRCNMAGRYQEYVVNFGSVIDQEMTHEMFNEVIIFIDEQMAHYRYKD